MRFAHFRDINNRDFTLAYTVEPTTNPLFVGAYEVRVGVAIRAPGDQFVKAKGRMIAEGRWEKRPFVFHYHTNDNRTILSQLHAELSAKD